MIPLIGGERRNLIKNSRLYGAVDGSAGTLPTNFTTTLVGLTRTISNAGTHVNGLPIFDIRFNGTTSGTAIVLGFSSTTQIPTVLGQTYTLSMYLALIAGAFTNITAVTLRIREHSSTGVNITNNATTVTNPTSTLTRVSSTSSIANATAFYVAPSLTFVCNNASAVDFTIRVAGPQLEIGSVATSFIGIT